MTPDKIFLPVIVLIALLGATHLQAGPIDPARHPHPENAQAVHEAEHDVDHAWAVYHRAALGERSRPRPAGGHRRTPARSQNPREPGARGSRPGRYAPGRASREPSESSYDEGH